MKINLILQELEELSNRLGWEIRYEKGDFRSGSCKKDEQRLLIIQKKASPSERVEYIAKAMSNENLDDVFILPQVRSVIENQRIAND